MRNICIAIGILSALFQPTFLRAQKEVNIKFGQVSATDFNIPLSSAIDSNAQAIIVADIGNTSFVGNSKKWFSYVFTRKVRIKILDKNAVDLATVKIDLWGDESEKENDKLTDVSAITYNLENGKVVQSVLSKEEIFDEKLSKRRMLRKFTLPAVKEGSIIEYSYKITSYFYYSMPAWEFQNSGYPCLWSEYTVTIPALLGFKVTRQGVNPFYIDETSEGRASYNVKEKKQDAFMEADKTFMVTCNTIKRRWVIKDIYPLKMENYISTAAKYIDKLDFQLVQTYNGEDTEEHFNTWAKTTNVLLEDNEFAATLGEPNQWMEKTIDDILKGETDQLLKAKKIYYYITSNFTCINYYHPFLTTSLYDIAHKKSGTIGDINLLLVAMLKKIDISANPVLLSTREYGYSDPKHPLINKLNYVICRCWIKDRSYNLDASFSYLGFGQLPLNCYNGYARVISKNDTSFVDLNADSIKEKKTTIVTLANDEKNKGVLTGEVQIFGGFIESNNIRAFVQRNGKKVFTGQIKAGYGDDIEVEDPLIDSLQNPGEVVRIQYNFKFKPGPTADLIYFNPTLFSKSFSTNPFKTEERKYPVEMEYPIDETYSFNMEIPDGYDVDELPKSAKILYKENGGYFQYQIAKMENTIQFRYSVKLQKANFPSDDYVHLREFFTYVVKKQQEQIVFKRKKG